MSESPTPLAALLDTIAALPESRATIMRRILEKLPLGAFWNIRNAKAKLSDVYKAAAHGKPQVLQRAGDEMPVVVISLDSLCDVAMRAGPERLYDLVRRQAGEESDDIPDADLEQVLNFRGVSGVAIPNLDGIVEYGMEVSRRRRGAQEAEAASPAAGVEHAELAPPAPFFRHY